jgi:hypothetical protein
MPEKLDPIKRLSLDLAKASTSLSNTEARFLVDAYYQMQENRIRSAGQIRSMTTSNEPHLVLMWLEDQSGILEQQIKRALERYVAAHPVGPWLNSIHGIGPVIAAGLLAHIDINKAPTVGHIWAFGGYDPTKVWEKGKKRPFNAALKVLFWKAGQSFLKFHNDPRCYYGHHYAKKKEELKEKNERGGFADAAATALIKFNYRDGTDAKKYYQSGKLPPAHVDARARRYAVKLFLAHLHHEMYVKLLGKEPPAPYPIAHLGHAHYIAPPQISN